MLQIYVCDFQNDLIFPVYQGGFIGSYDNKGRVYVGDTSIKIRLPNT